MRNIKKEQDVLLKPWNCILKRYLDNEDRTPIVFDNMRRYVRYYNDNVYVVENINMATGKCILSTISHVFDIYCVDTNKIPQVENTIKHESREISDRIYSDWTSYWDWGVATRAISAQENVTTTTANGGNITSADEHTNRQNNFIFDTYYANNPLHHLFSECTNTNALRYSTEATEYFPL